MTQENGNGHVRASPLTEDKQAPTEEPSRCVYLLSRCLQPRFMLMEFLLAAIVVFTVAILVRMQHYAWQLPAAASAAQTQLTVIRWRDALNKETGLNSSLGNIKRTFPQGQGPQPREHNPAIHGSSTVKASGQRGQMPAFYHRSPPKPWLLIGIPTTPRMARTNRKMQVDYIGPTVNSFLAQLPRTPSHPLFGRVRLLVIDNSGHNVSHRYLDELRHKLVNNSKSFYVSIVDNPRPAETQGKDLGSRNKPGAKVRQQTLDMSSSLTISSHFLRNFSAEYFMLMEDDFIPCPHAFETLRNATKKANIVYEQIRRIRRNETRKMSSSLLKHLAVHAKRLTAEAARNQSHEGWIALRVSFAMNGIILAAKDISVLANYMRQHFRRRPPDHLIVEWFAGENPQSFWDTQGRTVFAYKHNLFHHEGLDSTVGHRWKSSGPKCYDVLNKKTLFAPEAFNQDDCNHDDISPCLPTSDIRNFDWPQDILLPLGKKNETEASLRAATKPQKPARANPPARKPENRGIPQRLRSAPGAPSRVRSYRGKR
eukprot:gb/GECG01008572.1/.p1 GENE.gb/GECG01008572.1/~~gb/GECG01008572.1/.p1  ORF type:complete len:539 (+),score=43.84 gb/GECG01008572.1/:1-1617(+)